MVYLILLGLTFFMQLFAASWYDLAQKSGDTKKAFKHKMICSSIYIADVLLCSAANKNFFSLYSIIFICAFAVFFLSDVIENKQGTKTRIFASALKGVGLCDLTVALISKNLELFKDTLLLSTPLNITVTVIIALLISFIVLIKKEKQQIFIFAASIIFIIQSVFFGIPLQQSPIAIHQTASCAVIMGACALFISNVLSVFDKKNSKSLLRINLYYFGLMFISCSVAIL